MFANEDDFLIEYCRGLRAKDFIVKTENLSRKKQGKREYLRNRLTKDLMKSLEMLFESTIDVPRIKVGKRKIIETLINEEALLLAKHLRSERGTWIPRIRHLAVYTKGGSKGG